MKQWKFTGRPPSCLEWASQHLGVVSYRKGMRRIWLELSSAPFFCGGGRRRRRATRSRHSRFGRPPGQRAARWKAESGVAQLEALVGFAWQFLACPIRPQPSPEADGATNEVGRSGRERDDGDPPATRRAPLRVGARERHRAHHILPNKISLLVRPPFSESTVIPNTACRSVARTTYSSMRRASDVPR